jgi:hypothetical protein
MTRAPKEPEVDSLDERNKRAPHVNPEHSGIRSGNPQLDPDRAHSDGVRPDRVQKDRETMPPAQRK